MAVTFHTNKTKTGLWRRLPEFEPPVDQSPPLTQVSCPMEVKRLLPTAGCHTRSKFICLPLSVGDRHALAAVNRERGRTPSQITDPVRATNGPG